MLCGRKGLVVSAVEARGENLVLEHQREGVRADPEETRVAQGRIAGEAAHEVPGARHRGIHEDEDQQVQEPVLETEQRQRDQQCDEYASAGHRRHAHMAPRVTLPNRPRGRMSRTRMRTTKKVISDQAGDIVAATTAEDVDTITPARTAPPTLPSPPRTTIDSSLEIRS